MKFEEQNPLPAACRDHRLDHWVGGSRDTADHASTCGTCRSWGQRQRSIARAFERLPRRPAPAGLEPLVRAEVERAPMAHALGALTPRRAPAVLDRLVAEEIADPARAAVRRQVAGLGRLGSPAGLDAWATSAPRSLSWRRLVAWGLPLAAAMVLAAPALVPLLPSPATPPQRADGASPQPRYALVMLSHPDRLHPMARSLAEAVAGAPAGSSVTPARR